ncbi:hypothetical protein [Morganella morganii]|uniref:hypothetical protein n=1 Tax=Morganella morganii TaxID=582 RepID=UPI0021D27263|nr:hypothetical protein [Morganella morganii]
MKDKELLKVAVALREYIDALPLDVVSTLPVMPGVDRDWVDEVIDNAQRMVGNEFPDDEGCGE